MITRPLSYLELHSIASRMSYSPPRDAKSIGLFQDNEDLDVRAAVIYDSITHSSANVHIYSASPAYGLHPFFLQETFKYPFEILGLEVLMTITPGNNEGSLAVSRALGFTEIFRIKDGWDIGVDLVIKEMRKAACRWIQKKAA